MCGAAEYIWNTRLTLGWVRGREKRIFKKTNERERREGKWPPWLGIEDTCAEDRAGGRLVLPISTACGYFLPEAKNIQLFTVTGFKSSSHHCYRFQQQQLDDVSITWDHLSVIETKDRKNEKIQNKWRSKWAESFINYSCFCRYFKILFETYHLTFSTRTQTEKTT